MNPEEVESTRETRQIPQITGAKGKVDRITPLAGIEDHGFQFQDRLFQDLAHCFRGT